MGTHCNARFKKKNSVKCRLGVQYGPVACYKVPNLESGFSCLVFLLAVFVPCEKGNGFDFEGANINISDDSTEAMGISF